MVCSSGAEGGSHPIHVVFALNVSGAGVEGNNRLYHALASSSPPSGFFTLGFQGSLHFCLCGGRMWKSYFFELQFPETPGHIVLGVR